MIVHSPVSGVMAGVQRTALSLQKARGSQREAGKERSTFIASARRPETDSYL